MRNFQWTRILALSNHTSLFLFSAFFILVLPASGCHREDNNQSVFSGAGADCVVENINYGKTPPEVCGVKKAMESKKARLTHEDEELVLRQMDTIVKWLETTDWTVEQINNMFPNSCSTNDCSHNDVNIEFTMYDYDGGGGNRITLAVVRDKDSKEVGTDAYSE